MGSFDVPWSEWSDPKCGSSQGNEPVQRVLLWFFLLQQDFLKLVVMKDWKTNTWWQCQMILCTRTVAVAGPEKTHLWCCVILSTPTCLGQGSFLVKQLLQFGIGVLIRSVLYHSVKYFTWTQIYTFALYYFNDISQNTILFFYNYFIGAERIWLVLHL